MVTVATPVLELAHVTTLPVRTFPPASLTVAVNDCVEPTDFVKLDGLIVTVLTAAGGAAESVPTEVPDRPSLVAVIVTEPAASTVTRPLEDTDARDGALLVHVTVRPVRMLEPASRSVAVSCCV